MFATPTTLLRVQLELLETTWIYKYIIVIHLKILPIYYLQKVDVSRFFLIKDFLQFDSHKPPPPEEIVT